MKRPTFVYLFHLLRSKWNLRTEVSNNIAQYCTPQEANNFLMQFLNIFKATALTYFSFNEGIKHVP